MKKLLQWFMQGALFIVPISMTFYLIIMVLSWIDGLVPMDARGVGLLVIILAFTFTGYLTSGFITRSLFEYIEKLMRKLPLISVVYSSLKDLISAFIGDDKKFDQAVLIQLNKENSVYRLGFITAQDLSDLGLEGMVGVYLPHSYNFSGNFFLVPKTSVTPLPDADSSDVMKYIVSGGVSGMKPQDAISKK